MRTLALAAVVTVATLLHAATASAQDLRGFAGGGVMSDLNDEHFPAFGGGVLIDLGQPWVAAGAQGELFLSWPYVAGRGGMFLQANVIPKGPVRPFVLAGFGSGESDGPMLGAGVEFRPHNGSAGVRASVEDYLAKVGTRTDYYTDHQITIRVALTFGKRPVSNPISGTLGGLVNARPGAGNPEIPGASRSPSIPTHASRSLTSNTRPRPTP